VGVNRPQSAGASTRPHRGPLKWSTIVMIPGIPELLKDIKTVEDHARACQSREEERMVLLTREEADVIESFRRFKAEGYDQ
jgi:hypothetical protein